MTDNVQWVLEREGAAGRVLFFAHKAGLPAANGSPDSVGALTLEPSVRP